MDLALNHNAKFTNWVVSRGLITEPFVLIDVGAQGGEDIRWRALDDYLIVHGFDPIEEVIQELAEANKGRPIIITTAWLWETPTASRNSTSILSTRLPAQCIRRQLAGLGWSRRRSSTAWFRSGGWTACW